MPSCHKLPSILYFLNIIKNLKKKLLGDNGRLYDKKSMVLCSISCFNFHTSVPFHSTIFDILNTFKTKNLFLLGETR